MKDMHQSSMRMASRLEDAQLQLRKLEDELAKEREASLNAKKHIFSLEEELTEKRGESIACNKQIAHLQEVIQASQESIACCQETTDIAQQERDAAHQERAAVQQERDAAQQRALHALETVQELKEKLDAKAEEKKEDKKEDKKEGNLFAFKSIRRPGARVVLSHRCLSCDACKSGTGTLCMDDKTTLSGTNAIAIQKKKTKTSYGSNGVHHPIASAYSTVGLSAGAARMMPEALSSSLETRLLADQSTALSTVGGLISPRGDSVKEKKAKEQARMFIQSVHSDVYGCITNIVERTNPRLAKSVRMQRHLP